MNDSDLLRYSRQILLPEVGVAGQQTLAQSSALLIGVGGLGSASALYLAAAGVGHLMIADFDVVALSNLARQVVHHTPDIGALKVDSAAQKLRAINPGITVTTLASKDDEVLTNWIAKADVVLDGSDNFATRFLVNRACVQLQKPLVSAAVVRFEGQLSTFKGFEDAQPCYQCLYPDTFEDAQTCVSSGILSPVAGVLGTLQALQALKVLLDLGEQLTGKLLMVDALDLSFRKVKISKDKSCKICAKS